jgi:hypothetical protein
LSSASSLPERSLNVSISATPAPIGAAIEAH